MNRNTLTASALALVLTTPIAMYSTANLAADNPAPKNTAGETKLSPEDQALLKFSETGNEALAGIRAARLAIFDGNPNLAVKMMESASSLLGKTKTEAPSYDVTSKVELNGKTVSSSTHEGTLDRVPVDGHLVVTDSFIATPEKQQHISKANEHFRNGERQKGIQELRLGDIAVTYTRYWLPIASAEARLHEAIHLAKEGQYYQSSLALKAIEDSMMVDSVTLEEAPKPKAS